jgi:transcriptional regulator with XRE-family HTH domain
MAKLGVPLQRSVLANFENGRRPTVTVAEVMAFAKVLGVPPVLLIYPLGSTRAVEVVPGERRTTWNALKWFTGRIAFPDEEHGFHRPLAGSPEDNQAWLDNGVPVILYEDHERQVTNWRWEYDRIPFIEEAAENADSDGERQAHEGRLEDLRRYLDRLAETIGDLRRQMRKVGIVPPPVPDVLALALAERPFVVYERADTAGRIREQRVVDAGSDADYELAAARPEWLPVDAPFTDRPKGFNLDERTREEEE